jgi:hypothetical protein
VGDEMDAANEPPQQVLVVIHKDCPLHEIVDQPLDDTLGDH